MSQHNAPSVTYPLWRSHWQAWGLSSFGFAALLVVGAWVVTSQSFGWQQCLGLAMLVGAGLAALYGWKNSPVGQLAWDGQVWRWESHGGLARVAQYELTVALDFQILMLLRIENAAHAKLWLWAERRAFPARWLDLRRAVYSPHRSTDGQTSPV